MRHEWVWVIPARLHNDDPTPQGSHADSWPQQYKSSEAIGIHAYVQPAKLEMERLWEGRPPCRKIWGRKRLFGCVDDRFEAAPSESAVNDLARVSRQAAKASRMQQRTR